MQLGKFLILAILGGAALAFCLVPCCTVKEDRDLCPGVLVLETALVTDEVDSLCVSISGATELYDVVPAPFQEEYRYNVEHGDLGLLVTSTATIGGALTIEYGSECPKLWLWSSAITFNGEIQTMTPVLHKRYCCLTLTVLSSASPYPYAFAVSGNVCGYSSGGAPAEGEFYVLKSLSSSGSCTICVPQQTDNSLMLDLMSEGGSVRSFAIGEYIAESGYDWFASDLSDLTLQIDFATTTLAISYDNWSDTVKLKHTI